MLKKKNEECQFHCTYSHITEEQIDFYIISLHRAKIRMGGFKYLSTEGGCSMGSVNYVSLNSVGSTDLLGSSPEYPVSTSFVSDV